MTQEPVQSADNCGLSALSVWCERSPDIVNTEVQLVSQQVQLSAAIPALGVTKPPECKTWLAAGKGATQLAIATIHKPRSNTIAVRYPAPDGRTLEEKIIPNPLQKGSACSTTGRIAARYRWLIVAVDGCYRSWLPLCPQASQVLHSGGFVSPNAEIAADN